MRKLLAFLKEEDGTHAVEYSLIAAVIALGILASLQGVRTWIQNQFTAVSKITP